MTIKNTIYFEWAPPPSIFNFSGAEWAAHHGFCSLKLVEDPNAKFFICCLNTSSSVMLVMY